MISSLFLPVCFITATRELKAWINGSGNIYYKESPQIISEIAGSGNVLPK